jgi:hypothetical protein
MDIELADVFIAGLGALLAWFVTARSHRATLEQYRLDASSVAADWLRDLRAWASEAVDVLAEASYTCRRGDPEPSSDEGASVSRCRHRLSALIDRGRFLLPNEREDEVGSHKPRAYRGLRHHALDSLVAAERVLGDSIALGDFPDRKSALIGLRREFVSSVQAIIDPQSFNQEVARVLQVANETRAKDPTLGGLLPDKAIVPSGAEGILLTAARRYHLSIAGRPNRRTTDGAT